MSDEEKKAIERLKNFGNSISCATYPPEAYIEMKEDIEDILYLIEKQSKEIEELNLKNEKLYEDNLTLAQEIKDWKEQMADDFENRDRWE